VARIEALFERAGLPVCGAAARCERYLELMSHDKKVEAGKLRLVLLQGRDRAQAVMHAERGPAARDVAPRPSRLLRCLNWRPTPSSDGNSLRGPGQLRPSRGPKARSEFQRDRDRIVHSTAFRRLEYKTQVFVNHEGDLFPHPPDAQHRGGPAHRAASRASLASTRTSPSDRARPRPRPHPFGHAGQDALNACMQGLRRLRAQPAKPAHRRSLEERYGAFDGLNLMFETREGILKHCSRANARELGELGRRFLDGTQPSLEAQICNLADEIAYNNHDVDDGLRSGLLTLEQLAGR
jgi:hypothetical protein